MPKFTFICDQGADYVGAAFKNTLEFECDTWMEATENFETFLRGAGFVFDSLSDDLESKFAKHDNYFDTDRNR